MSSIPVHGHSWVSMLKPNCLQVKDRCECEFQPRNSGQSGPVPWLQPQPSYRPSLCGGWKLCLNESRSVQFGFLEATVRITAILWIFLNLSDLTILTHMIYYCFYHRNQSVMILGIYYPQIRAFNLSYFQKCSTSIDDDLSLSEEGSKDFSLHNITVTVLKLKS